MRLDGKSNNSNAILNKSGDRYGNKPSISEETIPSGDTQ